MAVIVPIVAMMAVCIATSVSGTTTPPFMCGTTGVCNLEPDQPDQYCTSGPEGRCKSCADEASRCFTERMAFNCTSYCREIDNEAILKVAREKACVILGNVTNGYHNATGSSRSGDSVLVTCHAGYRVEGSDAITCLEFGVWSGRLPHCTDIICASPAIPNGKVDGDTPATAVGEYIAYSCDAGYSPDSTQSRARCLPDGTWHLATCHQVLQVPCTTNTAILGLAIGLGVISLILTTGHIIACLRQRKKYRDPLKGDIDRAHGNEFGYERARTEDEDIPTYPRENIDREQPHQIHYVSESHDIGTKEDKGAEAIPLAPRDPETPTAPNHQDLDNDDDESLPSVTTSSTESTERKDVPEPDHLPSGDDRNLPRSSPSRSSSLESDGNGAEKLSLSLGTEGKHTATFADTPSSNGTAGIHVNINIHGPTNTNSNNNYNNNNNCNNTDNNSNPHHQTNGFIPNTPSPEKQDSAMEETPECPDRTTVPKQETMDDARADKSDRLRSNGGSTNPDVGAVLNNAGRHAHPTDDGKKAKLVLPGNTVSLTDVKRNKQPN